MNYLNKVSIIDNFLAKEEFVALRDPIMTNHFPWFFIPFKSHPDEDQLTQPGQLIHMVYTTNIPYSQFYDPHFFPILDALHVSILSRIKINLQIRTSEPYFSPFHLDIMDLEKDITALVTTSILYINTNNGYTEFEDGTIVESVANRLVTFPADTKHRGVSQTDEQRRIVINFDYLEERRR